MKIMKAITNTFTDNYGKLGKHIATVASSAGSTILVVAAKKNPVLLPWAYAAIGATAVLATEELIDRSKSFVRNTPSETPEEMAARIGANMSNALFNTTQAAVVAAEGAVQKAEEVAEKAVNITLDTVEVAEETVEEIKEHAAEKAEEASDEFVEEFNKLANKTAESLQKAEEGIKEITEGIEKAKKTKAEKPIKADPEAPKKMTRKTAPKKETAED